MSGHEEEIGVIVTEEDEPSGAELAIREPTGSSVTLFGTDNPALVLEKATEVADALAAVLEKQKLYTVIKNRKHIHVEGWTLLGSMMGVFPEIEWTKPITDSYGKDAWEARCIARTRDGAIVGAREGMCSRSEPKWANSDDYAIRSMAQTRAISGALASPLRFIVVLAGFEGTPEAEMPQGVREERREETAGRVTTPRSWEQIIERMQAQLGADEAMEWLGQSKELKEMNAIESAPPLAQRLAGVVVDLEEAGRDWQFTSGARALVRDIFSKRLDGNQIDGPQWCLDGSDPAEVERPQKDEVLASRA